MATLGLILLCGYFIFERSHTKPSKVNVVNLPNELAIKAVVYQDLLGSPPNKEAAKHGGACFLEATEKEKTYLQSLFINRQPRVEVGNTNNIIFTKTNVMDRLTGKPSTLFWARLEFLTNRIAQAVGGKYHTSVAGVEYHYQLAFDGTNWIIQSKKQGVIW